MTSFQMIYDAFLNEIRDDEYVMLTTPNLNLELKQLLDGAIARFKAPRFNLTTSGTNFIADLTVDDIRILASLMKEVWLSHIVNNWENVKILFDERDFSPANQLDKLTKLWQTTITANERLQKQYSRAIIDKDGNKKVFDYSKLAGGRN